MSLKKYIGDRYVGTDSQKNEINPQNGSIFITTDTLRVYLKNDGQWLPAGAASIGDLENVNLDNLQNDQLIVFEETTGKWVNKSITEVLNLDKSLGELTNTVTGLDNPENNFLKWNGTEWSDFLITESDISDLQNYALNSSLSDYQEISEKNQANGYVGLDSTGKIQEQFLPALAITEVFVVANITERDGLTIGPEEQQVQEGDVAIVLDASTDTEVEQGTASYIFSQPEGWVRLRNPDVVPPGNNTEVLFNNQGEFGADARFTFDDKMLSLEGRLKLTDSVEHTYNLAQGESAYYVVTGEEGGISFTRIMAKIDDREVIVATYSSFVLEGDLQEQTGSIDLQEGDGTIDLNE